MSTDKKIRVVAFDASGSTAIITAERMSIIPAQELVKLIDMRMRDVVGWLTVCEVHDDISVPAVSLYEYFLPDNDTDLTLLLERIANV